MSNLKSRDDYIFTEIPEGFVVNGNTLPRRSGDGVDSKEVLRMEDIALLAEMVTERLSVVNRVGSASINRVISANRLATYIDSIRGALSSEDKPVPTGLSVGASLPSFSGTCIKWTYEYSDSCSGVLVLYPGESENEDESEEACSVSKYSDPVSASDAWGNFASHVVNATFTEACKAPDGMVSDLESLIAKYTKTDRNLILDPEDIKKAIELVDEIDTACIESPRVLLIGGTAKFYHNGEIDYTINDGDSVQGIGGFRSLKGDDSDLFHLDDSFANLTEDYYHKGPHAGSWHYSYNRTYNGHYGESSSYNGTITLNYGWEVLGGRLAIRTGVWGIKTKSGKWHSLVSSIKLIAITGICLGSGSSSYSGTEECPKDGKKSYEDEEHHSRSHQGSLSGTTVTFTLDSIDENGTCTYVSDSSLRSIGIGGGSTEKGDESITGSNKDADEDAECQASTLTNGASVSDSHRWFAGWGPYAVVKINPHAKP